MRLLLLLLSLSLSLSIILPAVGATFGGKSAPQAGHSNPVHTQTPNTEFNPNPSERRTLACWTLHLRSLIGGARGRRAGATGRRTRCGRRAVSSWPRRATAGRGAMAGGA